MKQIICIALALITLICTSCNSNGAHNRPNSAFSTTTTATTKEPTTSTTTSTTKKQTAKVTTNRQTAKVTTTKKQTTTQTTTTSGTTTTTAAKKVKINTPKTPQSYTMVTHLKKYYLEYTNNYQVLSVQTNVQPDEQSYTESYKVYLTCTLMFVDGTYTEHGENPTPTTAGSFYAHHFRLTDSQGNHYYSEERDSLGKGEWYVNGKHGESITTPITEFRVKPGEYTLEFCNEDEYDFVDDMFSLA